MFYYLLFQEDFPENLTPHTWTRVLVLFFPLFNINNRTSGAVCKDPKRFQNLWIILFGKRSEVCTSIRNGSSHHGCILSMGRHHQQWHPQTSVLVSGMLDTYTRQGATCTQKWIQLTSSPISTWWQWTKDFTSGASGANLICHKEQSCPTNVLGSLTVIQWHLSLRSDGTGFQVAIVPGERGDEAGMVDGAHRPLLLILWKVRPRKQ